MRKKGLFIVLLTMVFFTSCGDYQRLLKSRDPEEKYQAALRYFNDKQYVKAQTLLDDVSSYYKGTERSEDVLAYLARSYMGQKAYESATSYYQAYVRNYPKGKYAIEAHMLPKPISKWVTASIWTHRTLVWIKRPHEKPSRLSRNL